MHIYQWLNQCCKNKGHETNQTNKVEAFDYTRLVICILKDLLLYKKQNILKLEYRR
jgi:hypothetical protein